MTNQPLPRKLTMTPTSATFHDLLDQITEYHIPVYQRDYTWREEDAELFISDLAATFSSKTQRFFGPILIADNAPFTDCPANRTVVYVIDGQQRLTTLLLLLVALRHLALELSTYTQPVAMLPNRFTCASPWNQPTAPTASRDCTPTGQTPSS